MNPAPTAAIRFMQLSRRVAIASLAAWASIVAILTLMPGGYTPPLTLQSFLCIACGWRHAADIILNWFLFLPGGLLMARLLGGRRAVIVALAMTCGIETLQVGIPGRDPALQDLVFDTLGAWSGVQLGAWGLNARARRMLAAGVAAAWLGPAALLVPMTSDADLFGQWTPRFPNLDFYDGRIVSSRIGELELRSRRFEDAHLLDRAIRDRAPIDLQLVAGSPPTSLAPIFQVYDRRRKEILMVGALGQDLVLRGKNPSRVLRLDQPDARWVGAFRGVQSGDTIRIRVERAEDSLCAQVGERRACGLAPGAGDGWGFLMNIERLPPAIRAALNAIWVLALGLILGATLRGRWRPMVWAAGLAVAGLGLAVWSPDVRPDVVASALLIGSAGLGGYFRDRWKGSTPLLRIPDVS